MSTDDYAIGNADNFDVILIDGVERVEYDLAQVQHEKRPKYQFRGEMREMEPMPLGANISLAITDHLIDNCSGGVYGFIVPDYLLASFIIKHGDKKNMQVLRQ